MNDQQNPKFFRNHINREKLFSGIKIVIKNATNSFWAEHEDRKLKFQQLKSMVKDVTKEIEEIQEIQKVQIKGLKDQQESHKIVSDL